MHYAAYRGERVFGLNVRSIHSVKYVYNFLTQIRVREVRRQISNIGDIITIRIYSSISILVYYLNNQSSGKGESKFLFLNE